METELPFEIAEACSLIDQTVTDTKTNDPRSISEIGLICGVLNINDEPEIVVKFIDGLRQFTKKEFDEKLRLI